MKLNFCCPRTSTQTITNLDMLQCCTPSPPWLPQSKVFLRFQAGDCRTHVIGFESHHHKSWCNLNRVSKDPNHHQLIRIKWNWNYMINYKILIA